MTTNPDNKHFNTSSPTSDEATQTENCVATQTEAPKSPKKKMPQCWDTFGTIGESRMFDSRFLDPTTSFINKANNKRELLVLRHFMTRSLDEWRRKMAYYRLVQACAGSPVCDRHRYSREWAEKTYRGLADTSPSNRCRPQ